MSSTVLHVRAESKPLEHRSAVTPTVAKQLVDAGYTVNVERSPLSIFEDGEYEGTGATLVPTGSWLDAPSDHIIVGLKELPEEDFPLKHTVTMSQWRSETFELTTNFSMYNLHIVSNILGSISLIVD
jgi:saccharopine dehydrogenase (NAD+, L-lysine-forming)